MSGSDVSPRVPDPRGVRVTVVGAAEDLPPVVMEPPAVPVVPAPPIAGVGLLGGIAMAANLGDGDRGSSGGGHLSHLDDAGEPRERGERSASAQSGLDEILVDDRPLRIGLQALDPERAVLRIDHDEDRSTDRVLLLPSHPATAATATRREVIIRGWRIELEVEPAARAALRERARRGREEAGHSGPTEVHAIIPGVVVSVSVTPGDQVVAGQQLLVVEAMKMQNELRAPRDGTIERVAVAPGRTIEVGDLLLVIA